MKIIIFSAIGLIAITGVNLWALGIDGERSMAVVLYEKCVLAEYGTTPLKFYEEHKHYPTCGN